ncbi:MAG: hypothetical protein IJ832_00835 [Bacteroidaceae bacterium]|nr:hypothetical protein [Bacteroidaceae bacterium]
MTLKEFTTAGRRSSGKTLPIQIFCAPPAICAKKILFFLSNLLPRPQKTIIFAKEGRRKPPQETP